VHGFGHDLLSRCAAVQKRLVTTGLDQKKHFKGYEIEYFVKNRKIENYERKKNIYLQNI
jgi:hypothetical protein